MIKFLIAFAIAFSAIAATKIKDNTLKVGKQDGQDVYIYANEGSTNSPFLVFDVAEGKWKQSNDGTNIIDIGSGSENFVDLTGNQTITGIKTFNAQTIVKDGASPVSLLYKIISNDELTNYFSVDSNGLNTDLNFAMNGTGAIKVPVGDTSERPTPAQGMLRYNTEEESFEGYNGTEWGAIGGGGGGGSAGINFVVDSSFEKNDLAFTNSLSGTTTYPLYTSNDKLYSEFNEVYFQIAHTGLSAANYSTSYTVSRTGLDGKQGLVSIWAKTAAELDLCVDVDTNGCDTTLTLINDDTWRKYEVPIVFGSGNVLLKFINASITGDVTLQLDKVYVGTMPDGYIQDVGQAHFVGGIRYTQSGSNDSDCREEPTSGLNTFILPDISNCDSDRKLEGSFSWDTDSDQPSINVNVNAGTRYLISVNDLIYKKTVSGGQCFSGISIDGGVSTLPVGRVETNTSDNHIDFGARIYEFKAETTGSINIQYMIRASVANNCEFMTRLAPLDIVMHAYPDSSSTIVSQNTELTAKTANEFSARIASNGFVQRENYDWINGNCVVTDTSLITCTLANPTSSILNCQATAETADRNIEIQASSTTQISFRARSSSTGGNATANFTVGCSKSGADVNKSATIVGKFSSINSSDLVKVSYAGINSFSGQAVPYVIKYQTKKQDTHNAYNTSTGIFTVPTGKAGLYNINANFSASYSETASSLRIIKNGSDVLRFRPEETDYSVHEGQVSEVLQEGDTIEVRVSSWSGVGTASSINNTDQFRHTLTITQDPDYEAIVKNLSNQKTKYQQKFLQASTTTAGLLPDLQLSNLTIGKKYRITLNVRMVSGANNCEVRGTSGSGLVVITNMLQPDSTGISDRYVQTSVMPVWVADNSTINFNMYEITSCNLEGNTSNLNNYTWVMIEELPDTYVETTEF